MPGVSLIGLPLWLCTQVLFAWFVYRETGGPRSRSSLLLAVAAFVSAHVFLFAADSVLTVLLVEVVFVSCYLVVDQAVEQRVSRAR